MPIDYRQFIHEDDQASLEALKAIPGFDKLAKKFTEVFAEKYFHIEHMSSCIKLGPEQMPEIYNLLPPICKKLDIVEPELYLKLDRSINAMTIGDTNVAIIINSGLIETLSLEEVQTVLAHECGHILCRHCLYHTMGGWLLSASDSILSSFGLLSLLTIPLRLGFVHWMRSSEFSADRVSAYFRGGSDKVIDVLIRLAGATSNLGIEVNKELFLQQAKGYKNEIKQSGYSKFLEFYRYGFTMDHPLNAYRAYELNEWCKTTDFQNILNHIGMLPDEYLYDTTRKVHLDIEKIAFLDGQNIVDWFAERRYLYGTKNIIVHCGMASNGFEYVKKLNIDKNKAVYQCITNKDNNVVAHRVICYQDINKDLENLFVNNDGFIIAE